jgi:pentatricopeptide repeat protein
MTFPYELSDDGQVLRSIELMGKSGVPVGASSLAEFWQAQVRAASGYAGAGGVRETNLLMPLMGFVSPTDPMWLSTLDAMNDELVSDSLVYRYDPAASPDGLAGPEGTFSICTFWYVDALARSGRLEEARMTFEKMLTYANHVGLYSEEIGPTGEQLGNFPQAFTHLSLINAAMNLDFQLDHGPGMGRSGARGAQTSSRDERFH